MRPNAAGQVLPGCEVGYSFDAIGNRIESSRKATGRRSSYSANANGRLISVVMLWLAGFLVCFNGTMGHAQAPTVFKYDSKYLKDNCTRALTSSELILRRAAQKHLVRASDINAAMAFITDPEERQVVYNVAWCVVAVGEYGHPEGFATTFLESTERALGDLIIPETICFPDQLHRILKAYSFTAGSVEQPYPEPYPRPFRELITEARVRLNRLLKNPSSSCRE